MFSTPAHSLPVNKHLSLLPPLPRNPYFDLYHYGLVILVFQLHTHGIIHYSPLYVITSFTQHYMRLCCGSDSSFFFIAVYYTITVSFSYCKYHSISFSYWWTFRFFPSSGLLWVMLLWIFLYLPFCRHKHSSLLGIDPRVELLDHVYTHT